MKKILSIVLISILCLTAYPSFSQAEHDSANLRRVETIDGNEYIGLLVAEDSLHIELDTPLLGRIPIPKTSIKSISQIKSSSMKDGKLWFENPQSSRYFWSPNGYGLKKGEGYYQNIWVLWNQASVGVTDYFSIGAGLIPLFFFGGTATPVWIVPKFSIPVVKDKFNIGAGVLAGTLLGESNTGFGIVYGLGTVGNRNNNLTLGFGYGYAGGQWASRPLFTLSGMVRVGPRGYLMSENYFIGLGSTNLALLSLGARTIIKKAGIDYGLFFPASSDIGAFIAIPWLGFTLPFGK